MVQLHGAASEVGVHPGVAPRFLVPVAVAQVSLEAAPGHRVRRDPQLVAPLDGLVLRENAERAPRDAGNHGLVEAQVPAHLARGAAVEVEQALPLPQLADAVVPGAASDQHLISTCSSPRPQLPER